MERTSDETLEKRLVGEVSIVLLEVLLCRGGELDSDKLEARRGRNVLAGAITPCVRGRTLNSPTILKARDDRSDQATLQEVSHLCTRKNARATRRQ